MVKKGKNSALDFILNASEWPLGALLAAAGSAETKKKGVDIVACLMKNDGVDKAEIETYAPKIYAAIRAFVKNSGFCIPVDRDKY